MATLTTLVSFPSPGVPTGNIYAGVTFDAHGNLFGTTYFGGTDGGGSVYEITKDSNYSTLTTLASFNGADGLNPRASLVADGAGNLFGTTLNGGVYGDGTVFEIAKTATGYASTPIVLASFNGTNGQNPLSNLFVDTAGNLFGTTQNGGAYGKGTVFEIAKTATGYADVTSLVSFNGLDGANPASGLIADASGNLFGTAPTDTLYRSNGPGTVFEIVKTPTGYASTPYTLHYFNGDDGVGPAGPLVADAAGNLFGVSGGGAYGNGTVFEIAKTDSGYASTATTLVTFNYGNGAGPNGGLAIDAAGNLFGSTSSGGAYGGGTLFEIANTDTGYASTPTTLVTFHGDWPTGSLIADTAGNLFGATLWGGNNNWGSVFELSSAFTPFVTVSGTAQDGQTLTANPNVSVAAYQWQELVGGTWLNLGGATDATYLVQQADIGRQIRIQVTDSGGRTEFSAATDAVLDAAGNQFVYESADQTTIGTGLFQYVYGTATNATVNSGGEQNIYQTGTAAFTALNAGGVQIDWGSASNTTLDGGNQYVWGTATDTTIILGVQYVSGVVSRTIISDTGEQAVYGSGMASDTTVAGGTQSVYGGADQTTVSNGGFQEVHGSVTKTTIEVGEQNVYSSGIATGTTLNAGAVQVDWGSAIDTTINGGDQYVWGTADHTTISSGSQHVGAGGIANDSTIHIGALEYVHTGGAAHDVTFSGTSATLVLDQSSALSGTVSGWQAGDEIDFGDIPFSHAGSALAYAANADNSGGTLMVSNGSQSVTLALLGQYTAADFALSSNQQGGTILIDPVLAMQTNAAPSLATPV